MSRRRTPTAALIGAPTDVGASERGASMGPEALRVAGLARRLEEYGLKVVDRGNLAGPGNPGAAPLTSSATLIENGVRARSLRSGPRRRTFTVWIGSSRMAPRGRL